MSKKIRNYKKLFDDVIQVIEKTRIKAYKSLTKHQLSLNFEIGEIIVNSQEKQGWGKGVVNDLSKDINKVIDGLKGYSPQNLWRMRSFYLEYKDLPELLNLALQIPWSQNLLIISKVSKKEERRYYLDATIKLGWSRAVLLNQIKANAYAHHMKNAKLHNFKKALPVHLSEQATEALKSEYNYWESKLFVHFFSGKEVDQKKKRLFLACWLRQKVEKDLFFGLLRSNFVQQRVCVHVGQKPATAHSQTALWH